ncbi:MAG: TIGR03619 family F420-dependent LLM class oxidoreductase [Actinomycetota bacterium]|nr:TIGR03619 family F420-dependent LLM class oxidoreductase [Actinomycetota bacterium]
MKVGLNLVNFGPAADPETLGGWARLAERLGFHSLLTSDHIAVTPDVGERYPGPFYEPLGLLGWLAGVTERIAIGTTVIIVPYRNPLELARSLANTDQLSGGRLIFGVGVGWARQEFAALGVPYHERGAMTDEYLDLILRHWTESTLTFTGRFVSCVDVDTSPPPRQTTVPLWVGGGSDAAIRRAVQFGTAWHPIRIRASSFAERSIPRLESIADEMGRPRPELCPRILFHVTDDRVPDEGRFMGHGTLEQIHSDLHRLQELGCAHVILDAYSPFDDQPFRNIALDRTGDGPGGFRRVWEDCQRLADVALDLANERVR